MSSPGRNDACHCGSGKKYKNCCLGKDEAKAREARTAAAEAQPEDATATAAAAQGESHAHGARSPKHVTSQPWKRAETRGAPKFNIPRRSGGS